MTTTQPGERDAAAAAERSADLPPPDSTSSPAETSDGGTVTVDGVRRVHLSEDWLATIVGLTILTVGLLGLIPEGLVP